MHSFNESPTINLNEEVILVRKLLAEANRKLSPEEIRNISNTLSGITSKMA